MKLVISLCVLLVASIIAKPQGIISPIELDGGIVHTNWLTGLGAIMSKRQLNPDAPKDNSIPSTNSRQVVGPCPKYDYFLEESEGFALQLQGYNVTCHYWNFVGRVVCQCHDPTHLQ